jgi:hypothetical protein
MTRMAKKKRHGAEAERTGNKNKRTHQRLKRNADGERNQNTPSGCVFAQWEEQG